MSKAAYCGAALVKNKKAGGKKAAYCGASLRKNKQKK